MKKNDEGQWEDDPVHQWFGLTYSNYFTVPRMALQAMPLEWQKKFVALMDEFAETGIETPNYIVLRDDPAYTRAVKVDPEDEYSDEDEWHKLQTDPWASYRHPDYSLLPEALRPASLRANIKK